MSAMTMRMELFVRDIAASVAFYRDVVGFDVVRQEDGYAELRNGAVTLGLGRQDRLPPNHHFGEAALQHQKGVGIEVVLEVDDVEAWHARVVAAAYPVAVAIGRRPWGLTDFRIIDPDGYYLRITSRS